LRCPLFADPNITDLLQYDTIEEINVDSKAAAPLIQYRLRSVKSVQGEHPEILTGIRYPKSGFQRTKALLSLKGGKI